MSLSTQLKKLREDKGLSVSKVIEDLGMTESRFRSYETGSRQPTIEILNQLADYYGVSVDTLLGRAFDNVPQIQELDDMELEFLEFIRGYSHEVQGYMLNILKKLFS